MDNVNENSKEKRTIIEFVPDLKFSEESGWTTSADDLLLDLKVFAKEYYTATFAEDEKSLMLKFKNGQKFKISVTEIEW